MNGDQQIPSTYQCTCPHCHSQLTHNGTRIGRIVQCPGCKAPFQIPLAIAPDHEAEAEAERLEALEALWNREGIDLSGDPPIYLDDEDNRPSPLESQIEKPKLASSDTWSPVAGHLRSVPPPRTAQNKKATAVQTTETRAGGKKNTQVYCWAVIIVICLICSSIIGQNDDNSSSSSNSSSSDVDQAVEEVMDQIMSTPEGRAEVDRIGNREVTLTRFQQSRGISERIAEAAIKEWVLTHNGNFDWDLEDVKAICVRNKRSGIPYDYLPESEK